MDFEFFLYLFGSVLIVAIVIAFLFVPIKRVKRISYGEIPPFEVNGMVTLRPDKKVVPLKKENHYTVECIYIMDNEWILKLKEVHQDILFNADHFVSAETTETEEGISD